MEVQTRSDLFETGDATALVCIDEPDLQKTVVEQLAALSYKIHTGLFVEDISLKMRTHVYDVVVIYESFNDSDLETNQVLAEMTQIPSTQRRLQFLVLIGSSMVSSDEMVAFLHGVDLAFSISDVANLKPVLRRAVLRHKEFYLPLSQTMKSIEEV